MHDGPNRRRTRSARLALVALLALLPGCAQIGIRPGEPEKSLYSPCADLKNQVDYAKELAESYRSRASLNRFAIYAAGIVGLGTAAATGGLGAAGAAALTLTLLSVSGGFATGSVAVIQNDQLADCYTDAANELDTGVRKSLAAFDRKLACTSDGCPDPDASAREWIGKMDPANCEKPLRLLECRTTKARNDLETARTQTVAGLLKRMEVQQKKIGELAKKVDAAATTTSTTTSTTIDDLGVADPGTSPPPTSTTSTTIPKDDCELEEEQRPKS